MFEVALAVGPERYWTVRPPYRWRSQENYAASYAIDHPALQRQPARTEGFLRRSLGKLAPGRAVGLHGETSRAISWGVFRFIHLGLFTRLQLDCRCGSYFLARKNTSPTLAHFRWQKNRTHCYTQ
jgi:hypothetical protein